MKKDKLRPRSQVLRALDGRKTLVKRVVFDIETEPFSEAFRTARSTTERKKHAPKMRLACVFHELLGEYRYYTEKNARELIEELSASDEVISYNGKQFDVLVLQRHYGLVGKVPVNGRHIDIFSILSKRSGFNVSLNVAARVNLREGKHTDGREMAMLDLHQLKVACRSDVSQTYRLWLRHKDGRLQYPTARMKNTSDFEVFMGPGDHMPNHCPSCSSTRVAFTEWNAEGMSDGQLSDYEAGFYGSGYCKKCKSQFDWGF